MPLVLQSLLGTDGLSSNERTKFARPLAVFAAAMPSASLPSPSCAPIEIVSNIDTTFLEGKRVAVAFSYKGSKLASVWGGTVEVRHIASGERTGERLSVVAWDTMLADDGSIITLNYKEERRLMEARLLASEFVHNEIDARSPMVVLASHVSPPSSVAFMVTYCSDSGFSSDGGTSRPRRLARLRTASYAPTRLSEIMLHNDDRRTFMKEQGKLSESPEKEKSYASDNQCASDAQCDTHVSSEELVSQHELSSPSSSDAVVSSSSSSADDESDSVAPSSEPDGQDEYESDDADKLIYDTDDDEPSDRRQQNGDDKLQAVVKSLYKKVPSVYSFWEEHVVDHKMRQLRQLAIDVDAVVPEYAEDVVISQTRQQVRSCNSHHFPLYLSYFSALLSYLPCASLADC